MELDEAFGLVARLSDQPAMMLGQPHGAAGGESVVLWCNPALLRLLEIEEAALVGKPVTVVLADWLGPGDAAQLSRGPPAGTSMVINLTRQSSPDGRGTRLLTLRGVGLSDTGAARWFGLLSDTSSAWVEKFRPEALDPADMACLSLATLRSQDGILVLDNEMRVIWANDSYITKSGWTLDAIRGRRPIDYLSEVVIGPLQIRTSTATETRQIFEQVTYTSKGYPYWVEIDLIPIEDSDGKVQRHVLYGRDIRQRKAVESAQEQQRLRAEAAEARLWSALEVMPDGFALYDADDRLVFCNQTYRLEYHAVAHMLTPGTPFEDIIRAGAEAGLFTLHDQSVDDWVKTRMALHRQPEATFEQVTADDRYVRVVERRTATGDRMIERIDLTEARHQQRYLERLAGDLLAAKREIELRNEELVRAQAEVQHAALHDSLTGLANRRYLDQRLASALDEARASGRSLALLHLDLDRFKQINDTLGHAAGDAVLKAVARTLRQITRQSDFVARVGGDEFVILCFYDPNADSIDALAERLVIQLREPVTYQGHLCRFGCSIGIATDHEQALTAPELLVNADIALYRAKNQGRNGYAFFTEILYSEMMLRKRTADELIEGLEKDQFLPHYQLQFRLPDLDILGAEALARWQHPTRGLLGPFAFIDIAEDLNLIASLDERILKRAMADWYAWSANGVPIPGFSVNVSSRRLSEPDLIDTVRAMHIPPGVVAFELLESIYLDNAGARVTWTIDALREMGIAVELDDFGSGYASVLSLVRLRPDTIKIDQQLIRPITEDQASMQLVESIVHIGHSLGVKVIAEGVETRAHLAKVIEAGCDAAQGHALAKPMGFHDLVAYVSGEVWREAI